MPGNSTSLSCAALLSLSALSLVGCGTDFADEAAHVEGIYQVTSYTLNPEACAPGGASQLGDHGYAVAAMGEFFGFEFLTVTSCTSPANCREVLALADADQPYPIEFNFGVDKVGEDGALTGRGASTGGSSGDVCTQGEARDTTLRLDGEALRIEVEITIADDYPVDANDGCSTDAARAAADGNPCSQLEVLTATRVEAL